MAVKKKKNPQKSTVLQRLAQASVEELATQGAFNAVMPGAGIALKSLKSAKNIKEAGKVMGKGAAKEGVQMLDDKEPEKSPVEDLSKNIALEMLARARGRN